MEVPIEPLFDDIPETIELEELSQDSVYSAKRGKEDSSLATYLNTGIVSVYETEDYIREGNYHLSSHILEKDPNDAEKELTYGILMSELNAAPDILYIRENEDGELRYGMPFLQDYGMFGDIEFNSFSHFTEFVESVGRQYSRFYQHDLIHGDLIGMRTGNGEWTGTPKLRNTMISSDGDTQFIDMEDTRFQDEPLRKSRLDLREMNPESKDDEYDAVLNSLLVEGIMNVDFFEKQSETELDKRQLIDYDDKSEENYINRNRLLQSNGVFGEDFKSIVKETLHAFEHGIDQGMFDLGGSYEQFDTPAIPKKRKSRFYREALGVDWARFYLNDDERIPHRALGTETKNSIKLTKERKKEIQNWVENMLRELG